MFNGYAATSARAVDISIRAAWQRTWCTAVIPPGARNADLTLFVAAPAGSVFYSTAPQLDLGHAPLDRPPSFDSEEGPGETSGPSASPGGSIFERARTVSRGVRTDFEAATDGVLTLAELGALLPGADPAVDRPELGLDHVASVAAAGAYRRRPVYDLDDADADESTKVAVAAYFKQTTTGYGASHLVRLRNAIVAGEGAVVAGRKVILLDSMREYLAYGRRLDGFEPVEVGSLYRLAREPVRTIAGPTLLIGRPFYANFGHWLVEGAAQIALLSDWVTPDWTIAVSRQPSDAMRRVVETTIRACLPGRNPVILERPDDEAWEFEDLYYGSPVHVPPLFKFPTALDKASDKIVDHAERTTGQSARQVGRIFVSRRHAGHRRLLNEDELAPILRRYRFETIFPEDHSFEEQVMLFRHAHAVIGAKGAGLTSIMFSKPDTTTIMLSPGDNPDPFFWDIAGMRRMRYAELFGPVAAAASTRGFNDFTIDPGRLETMLWLLFRDGAGPAETRPT